MAREKSAKTEKKYDLIIIGGGPAGLSAGIYAARQKLKALMIAKDFGGQLLLTSSIENYLGFKQISGIELTKRFEEHFKGYNVPVEKNEVTEIAKKGGNFLIKAGEKEFESKAIIITAGRVSRKLNVSGENRFYGKGISSCSICDAPLFNGKTVSVIGTGNSAVNAVLHLAEYAKKIYLITKYDKLKGDKIKINKILELEKRRKIEILYEAKTLEVLGKDFVDAIKIRHKEKEKILKVDGIFIEIGMMPETEFIDFVEKTEKNEIIVNNQCESSIKGIFAAGDCTNSTEKQIITSAGEGCKAALNAAKYIAAL